MSFNLLTLTFYWDLIYCIHVLITLRAAQCIVIGPVCGRVCGFVRLFVCLWVCYHDNSKLRASILTKLSLKVKVSSWLNFGRPAHPGRGSAASENFRLRVSIARAHYLRLSKRFFFILDALEIHNDDDDDADDIDTTILRRSAVVLTAYFSTDYSRICRRRKLVTQ